MNFMADQDVIMRTTVVRKTSRGNHGLDEIHDVAMFDRPYKNYVVTTRNRKTGALSVTVQFRPFGSPSNARSK